MIKFKARALIAGYRDILSVVTQVPPEEKDLSACTKEEVEERKRKEVAYAELLLSMTDEVRITEVNESVTNDLPTGNVKLGWSKLSAMFAPKDATSKMLLLREFSNSHLNENKDPEDWMVEL